MKIKTGLLVGIPGLLFACGLYAAAYPITEMEKQAGIPDGAPQAVGNTALQAALIEEVGGRLSDPANSIDFGRFATKNVAVDLSRIKRADLKKAEALAQAKTALNASNTEQPKLAVRACFAYAAGSGRSNETMFQRSTVELYNAADANPANYATVTDRCLDFLAAQIASSNVPHLTVPVGLK